MADDGHNGHNGHDDDGPPLSIPSLHATLTSQGLEHLVPHIIYAAVIGSHTTQTARPDSDIDVVVVLDDFDAEHSILELDAIDITMYTRESASRACALYKPNMIYLAFLPPHSVLMSPDPSFILSLFPPKFSAGHLKASLLSKICGAYESGGKRIQEGDALRGRKLIVHAFRYAMLGSQILEGMGGDLVVPTSRLASLSVDYTCANDVYHEIMGLDPDLSWDDIDTAYHSRYRELRMASLPATIPVIPPYVSHRRRIIENDDDDTLLDEIDACLENIDQRKQIAWLIMDAFRTSSPIPPSLVERLVDKFDSYGQEVLIPIATTVHSALTSLESWTLVIRTTLSTPSSISTLLSQPPPIDWASSSLPPPPFPIPLKGLRKLLFSPSLQSLTTKALGQIVYDSIAGAITPS